MKSLKKINLTGSLVLLLTRQGAEASLGKVISGVIGVGVATVALSAALGIAGFTAAGITAVSYAAGMMSASAMASGGGVAVGSTVAVLQSVGGAAGVQQLQPQRALLKLPLAMLLVLLHDILIKEQHIT
ncbi:interferon alpha-inducible protein 27-like protein 2A [Lytechinus variegatus]|uniref:interferon alpha-inducible protein 27-like protein 2A n=1 Tax=Lytechinus variegatus TaxID=7654 RepID=UPI001BB2383D|nr:interferon alpha-inducible protein 27-like protein 2A [Lytechinus variegatus]